MSTYENLSETQKFACRVIADHARSTAFSIADGILPGNEGRNYVLRKIMRRAIYHGREHLGFNEPFFYKVCDFVVDEMQAAFPELGVQRGFIGKMVRLEEERFGNTMTVGLGKLGELSITPETQPNDELFLGLAKLYDTYGTPRDLIRVFLEEKGLAVEEDDYNERFDAALQELQKQSGIGQTQRKSEISPIYGELLERVGVTEFVGYEENLIEDARVVAILDENNQMSQELLLGEKGSVVLDRTPFYAESGGQVGDRGLILRGDKNVLVSDTFSPMTGLIVHKVLVRSGNLKVGDAVRAEIETFARDATRRNHTATHLVHAALKEVLGTHVKQAGSVVAPNYLRFDFTHYQPMTAAEIREVEDLVNRYVLQNEPVTTNMMSLEDAMRSGAVAMFGEKYGSKVRVLRVGDGKFSMELCGGTHVRATGDIGSFKITSDEAIASGVRRIRAITGFDAFERFREDEVLIDRSLEALKTQRDNLPAAIERLQEEVKRTRKEIEELKLKIATGAVGNGSAGGDEAREIGGVKVLGKIVDGLDANGQRQLSDTLLARLKSGVVVLGRKDEGKASIIVRVSADLTDKIKAGNIVKEIVPLLGGRGGGRPDMAEGGGPDADKLSEAIDAAYASISAMIGNS
ncbi:MAG TPA: alanine--tRNA ligase [Blastocatellia bacterium]|nr:alanine--tRNA ligase [Blastocatellia bacterium]